MMEREMDMPDLGGLHALVRDTDGWGAMVLLSPPGDSPFLVSIVPELRNTQIVSFRGHYDIWRKSATGMELIHSELTKKRVIEMIRAKMPSEKEFEKHGAKWAEETFEYYGVPKKRNV